MHDNAVTCLNATAKKLIGEQDTPKTGGAEDHTVDEDFLASLNLPGNSARSARIEQTVSAWNTPEPTMPAARPKSAAPSVPLSPIDSGTIATTPPSRRRADAAVPERIRHAGAARTGLAADEGRNIVPHGFDA